MDEAPLSALVPEGHVLHELWWQFDLAEGTFEAIPLRRRGALLFDGEAGAPRPASWPTIYQVLDEDLAVARTGSLLPGEACPREICRPPGRGLFIGSGVAAGIGVASLALYLDARGRRWPEVTDLEEMNAVADAQLRYSAASWASGGVALGLGCAAAAVRFTW